jgi:hypothetical protein
LRWKTIAVIPRQRFARWKFKINNKFPFCH